MSKYRHITLIFVYNTVSKAYHAIKLWTIRKS